MEAASPEARRWSFAGLFALFTYVVMAARGILLEGGESGVLSLKRLLVSLAGALLYSLILTFAQQCRERPVAARIALPLAAVVPAAVCVFLVRTGLDWLMTGHLPDPSRNARWALSWLGYCAAWVGAWLALRSHSEAEAMPAAPAAAAAPPAPEAEQRPAGEYWVQVRGATVRIAAEEIEWVEAEGNYVRLHAGGTGGLLRTSLSGIEAELPADAFVRVHRSALCRKSAIRALRRSRTGALTALLESGAEVPVGRSFAARVSAITGRGRPGVTFVTA